MIASLLTSLWCQSHISQKDFFASTMTREEILEHGHIWKKKFCKYNHCRSFFIELKHNFARMIYEILMNAICPHSHCLKQTGANCTRFFYVYSSSADTFLSTHYLFHISEVFPKWGTCVHCHPSACFLRVWKITNQRLTLFSGTKGPCPTLSPLSAYWLQQCFSPNNTAERSTPFPLQS